jgi:hypothetical protein
VKLKRRDAAKAAEQDLNAQGWLPDWMVRPAPAAEAEEATEPIPTPPLTTLHKPEAAAFGRREHA